MPEDINDLDLTDAGLKAIMGNRFHDETCPEAQYIPTKEETQKYANVAKKPKEKAMEAQWEPVKENTWMDNLKACAIWAIGFGCLTFLFFSWQQAGLMDASVALPTMLSCTALGAWGVGKNSMRGKR